MRMLPADSRRGFLAAMASGVLASRLGSVAAAKERKKDRKRQPVLQRNSFGCVDVGKPCKGNDDNCCSGVCAGKKPKKGKKDTSRCVAHDENSCLAGQNAVECGGAASVACTTSFGADGTCVITTGKAPYCGTGGVCLLCTKDEDCLEVCQQGAACVPCAAECPQTGTICLGQGFCNNPD